MNNCAAPDCSKMIISFWYREPPLDQSGPEFEWPLRYSQMVHFPTSGTAVKHPLDTSFDRLHSPSFPQDLTSVGNDNQSIKFGDSIEGGKAGIVTLSTLSGAFDPRYAIGGARPFHILPPTMDGVWPLITFGADDTRYERAQWDVARIRNTPVVLTTQGPPFAVEAPIKDPPAACSWQPIGSEVVDDLIPQSFIGIYQSPVPGFQPSNLRICLWTNTFANYENWSWVITEGKSIIHQHWIWTFNPLPPFQKTGEQYAPPYPGGYEFHYEDKSDITCNEAPECFMVDINHSGNETWNHVLMSFDISGTIDSQSLGAIQVFSKGADHSSACRLWVAINDQDIPDFRQNLGVNAGNVNNTLPASTIISRAAEAIVGRDPRIASVWHTEPAKFPPLFDGDHNSEFYGHGPPPNQWGKLEMPKWGDPTKFDLPKYHGSNFTIPVHGYPIGVPVANKYVERNGGVEMAELQIWFDQSLDTSDIANRRLFVTENGKPANMKDAEDALGKPDIRLHGSSNWIHGKNTGSLGVDPDGNIKPDGQFNPVAVIRRFKPDPKVGV